MIVGKFLAFNFWRWQSDEATLPVTQLPRTVGNVMVRRLSACCLRMSSSRFACLDHRKGVALGQRHSLLLRADGSTNTRVCVCVCLCVCVCVCVYR
jgi:hypothetical protein